MSRHAPLALAVLLAAAAAPAQEKPQAVPARPAAAATAPPAFGAQAEMVLVDVVVADGKGRPIAGLRPSDFEVSEDGRRQTVVSFRAVTAPAAAPGVAGPTPRVSTNANATPGRSFVLVFDDLDMTPQKVGQARAAVAAFLQNGVREGDQVMLVATSGAAWWNARMPAGRDELLALVKRLEAHNVPDGGAERMSDYEAMQIHLYRDTQVWDRVTRRFEAYGVSAARMLDAQKSDLPGTGNAYVEGRAFEVYTRAVTRLKATLEVLERVLSAMASASGRKSLVLVSEGFIQDATVDGFRRVVEASRRSNVALYFLDSRGLEALPSVFGADLPAPVGPQDFGASLSDQWESAQGAEGLAADTGGFTIKNTNALAAGIQRIADESRTYYLLGYQPANTARDGRFRKIAVKVAGGGHVRARKGYYAPLEGREPERISAAGVDVDLQAALDSPYDVAGVPARMTHFVFDEAALGKAKVVVAADVDVRKFAFAEEGGLSVDALEFLLVVQSRETGEFFRIDRTAQMKLRPETRERYARTWFPLSHELELPKGWYQARLVVRDRNSGRLGSVVHEFEVPPLDGLRVSTPVISDVLKRQAEGEGSAPAPVIEVQPEFPNRGMVFLQFEVYHAAPDAKGLPRVAAGYVVRKPDGSALVTARPSLIQPTSLGALARVSGITVESAEPGEYQIVLQVEDLVAKRSVEVQERFRLTAEGEPAAAGTR